MKIGKATTVEELAALISQALTDAGLEAVLSGGSVVSIYTENEYKSHDLDFVTPETIKEIEKVMESLGFTKKKASRHFTHPKTEFFVEFPAAPLTVGIEQVREWAQRRTKAGTIQILTPTQSVMDRLAGFYAWKDRQNLDQAVMVARHQKISLKKVEQWSKDQGYETEYRTFLQKLKEAK